MRSEDEMMQLILDTAKNDSHVSVVMMNGSRVIEACQKDIFQDYDIVYFVDDLTYYLNHPDWIDVFGERLIMQKPDEIDNFPNPGCYTYLMQFADGNRIDLTLCLDEIKDEFIKKSNKGKIILDKLGGECYVFSHRDYSVKEPEYQQFKNCMNEFWWVSCYVAKGLWRNEIFYAIEHIDKCLRVELMKMLDWKAASEHDFSISTGKAHKYLPDYLTKAEYELLMSSYHTADIEECWKALFAICALFSMSAAHLAMKMHWKYDKQDEIGALKYLHQVHQLDQEATTIF